MRILGVALLLSLLSLPGRADVAPPEGQRYVGAELRLEHAERLTDHVVAAYPVVDNLRQAQLRVFTGAPIPLTRYGMNARVYVLPRAMVGADGTLTAEGAPEPNQYGAFDEWLRAQPGVVRTEIQSGGLIATSDTDFTTYVERIEVVRADAEGVELRALPLQNERGEAVTRPTFGPAEESEGCRAGGAGSALGAGWLLLALGWRRRS